MAYQPIKGDLTPDRRVVAPAGKDREATLALLRQFPDVAIYGLLLVSDPHDPVARMVQQRWSELHHLTGDTVLVVTFQPPPTWAESIQDYWRERLGDSFAATWQDWHNGRGLEPGAAFAYLDLFDDLKLKATQLPCLVLFTDLEKREAVVRSLPNWDEESLYALLMGMLQSVRECADRPQDERLQCLRAALTAPGPRAAALFGHLADTALHYLHEHPAQAALTSLSFVLSLASGNVLALSPAVVAVLTFAKEALAKGTP